MNIYQWVVLSSTVLSLMLLHSSVFAETTYCYGKDCPPSIPNVEQVEEIETIQDTQEKNEEIVIPWDEIMDMSLLDERANEDDRIEMINSSIDINSNRDNNQPVNRYTSTVFGPLEESPLKKYEGLNLFDIATSQYIVWEPSYLTWSDITVVMAIANVDTYTWEFHFRYFFNPSYLQYVSMSLSWIHGWNILPPLPPWYPDFIIGQWLFIDQHSTWLITYTFKVKQQWSWSLYLTWDASGMYDGYYTTLAWEWNTWNNMFILPLMIDAVTTWSIATWSENSSLTGGDIATWSGESIGQSELVTHNEISWRQRLLQLLQKFIRFFTLIW